MGERPHAPARRARNRWGGSSRYFARRQRGAGAAHDAAAAGLPELWIVRVAHGDVRVRRDPRADGGWGEVMTGGAFLRGKMG